MGKKIIKQNYKRDDVQDEDEDLEISDDDEEMLSDMEMQGEGEEKAEEINFVDLLNEHTEKIKTEFSALLAKKGGSASNWLETLNLTCDTAIDPNLNIDDDIKRELIFYNMTTANVMKGIEKLREVSKKILFILFFFRKK